MTAEQRTVRRAFKENFLKLPKELRDLIYAELYSGSAPVPLEDVQIGPAGLALLAIEDQEMDQSLVAEILEAFYTHHTFSLTLSDTNDVRHICPADCSVSPQYEEYIRKLVVNAEEAELGGTTSLEALELRCLDVLHPTRARWEGLLKLPRLEQLSIRLQKRTNHHFSWADFSPILIQLRKNLPKLQVSFSISFDTLLERYWSDPIWENYTEPGNVVEEPYDPMGFVDVTELIEPSTKEDVTYVQENLAENMETQGQDILRGLLDESAPQRRALALHYVVREPALLRVRIMEHYEVYKKMRDAEVEQGSIDSAMMLRRH